MNERYLADCNTIQNIFCFAISKLKNHALFCGQPCDVKHRQYIQQILKATLALLLHGLRLFFVSELVFLSDVITLGVAGILSYFLRNGN